MYRIKTSFERTFRNVSTVYTGLKDNPKDVLKETFLKPILKMILKKIF